MAEYADLEIGLHRRDADRYQVELRFNRPDSDVEDRLAQSAEGVSVQFDVNGLRAALLDDGAYGALLTANLFGSEGLRTAFEQARASAQTLGVPLRIRLFIGASAPELHSLRWETLRDPRDDSLLLTHETLLFSRYLSSFDWRPVRLRPQADLRALVCVANPSDVERYKLTPVDAPAEVERIKKHLGNVTVTAIPSGGCATLAAIITALRNGCDIFYLMAHGKMVENEPWLWLEQDDGTTHRVSGVEFITRLRELEQRPRLMVLASCQSAGTSQEKADQDHSGVLSALGPRLAEVGIPAVIAMQGNVSIETVDTFMPVFFEELQRDGQIDRAIAVARATVRERPDWWMPVLFMRLKSGRLWYAPGFAEEQGGLEKWPAVLRNIQRQRCTPILGPGLTEALLGTMRDMARHWAEKYHFPLAPYLKEDFPQVAQFLAIQQDPMFPRDELEATLQQAITSRYSDTLPPDLQGAPLAEMIETIGRQRRETDPTQPHRVLATLPLPIYITTDPSNLLKHALIDAGKDPQVELCRWNSYLENLPSIYDDDPNYRPTEQRPLIYHLFGNLEEPDSLVLTEDDYFDYLIGVTSNKDLIPAVVRRALVDTALLFLGFQMEDWNFRVLFRSIMSREGRSRRRDYAHVAAQVTPEEGRILEPERARRYLEQYFQDTNINIYWGSVEDFTKELAKQLERG